MLEIRTSRSMIGCVGHRGHVCGSAGMTDRQGLTRFPFSSQPSTGHLKYATSEPALPDVVIFIRQWCFAQYGVPDSSLSTAGNALAGAVCSSISSSLKSVCNCFAIPNELRVLPRIADAPVLSFSAQPDSRGTILRPTSLPAS